MEESKELQLTCFYVVIFLVIGGLAVGLAAGRVLYCHYCPSSLLEEFAMLALGVVGFSLAYAMRKVCRRIRESR